jgi:predicted nucleic acid-binding protein
MAMSELLVDTDVLIDVSRGKTEVINRLKAESAIYLLCISVVTEMEMIVGCRNKAELRMLDRFLSKFSVVALDPAISNRAAELLRNYRLSHGLLIPDALIAATAIELSIPFLSKNQKDYRFIPKLNLLAYP